MSKNVKKINGEELTKTYDIIKYIGALCDNDLFVETASVYDGDIVIDGDLTADFFDGDVDFVLVNGNLTVNGDINPDEETFPNLLILGNLSGNNLQNGEELVAISGNLDIKYVINTTYNSGGLKVDGKTKAQYLINNDHWLILPNLEVAFKILVSNDEQIDDAIEYDILKSDFIEKVQPKYLIEGVDVNMPQLIQDVKKGKEVFK